MNSILIPTKEKKTSMLVFNLQLDALLQDY